MPRLACQLVLTYSKSTIKTLGHVVKSVQSKQKILIFIYTSFQFGFLQLCFCSLQKQPLVEMFFIIAIFILKQTNRLRRLVRHYKQQVAIMSRFFLVKIKL